MDSDGAATHGMDSDGAATHGMDSDGATTDGTDADGFTREVSYAVACVENAPSKKTGMNSFAEPVGGVTDRVPASSGETTRRHRDSSKTSTYKFSEPKLVGRTSRE